MENIRNNLERLRYVILERLRYVIRLNFPFAFLIFFSFYFTYDLYTGTLFFSHNDYAGMYYPFRQWFLDRLMNLEFPLWNPYWGAGHEAVIWSTVPIDFFTIPEIFIRPKYEYFYLIHCLLLVVAGYYVFRKFGFEPWASALGALIFFMSPLVTYWHFEFIKTSLFVAHIFAFLFMVKWFETERPRYVLLLGWCFFLGMFGTKLEYWFFGSVFFLLSSLIASLIIKPKRWSMVAMVWASIGTAILSQAWQLNLLLNAFENSNRETIPHSIRNIFSPELYRSLFLTFGDSALVPLLAICTLLYVGVYSKSWRRWWLVGLGIGLSILCRVWQFTFLSSLVRSPILLGALLATVTVIRIHSVRDLMSAWILFVIPAYYWCRQSANFDELYLLGQAPALFKLCWAFLVWMGCLKVPRLKTAKLAYLCVILVLVLEQQGQVLLAYLFGYLWMPARDNYLIDFSFAVLAIFGTLTYFRLKPIILKLALLTVAFAAYPDMLYVLPRKHIPDYANPLLTNSPPYHPYAGVPGLRNLIKAWEYQPYRRVVDPDIEQQLPQNQGTFLLENVGNATFYGSMCPRRYSQLVNYHRRGITPDDKVIAYPSVYSEKTISRLPPVNRKDLSNGEIYYLTVWTIPPLELDIVRMLGVDHIVTRSNTLLPPLVGKLNLVNVMKSGEFNVAKVSDTLPRAFLVTNVTKGNLKDFKENMKPGIQMDAGEVMQPQGVYSARPVEIVEYKPEYVSIRTESLAGGYLVLSDVFHPYWSAAVDSAPAEIIPAFYAFRAVKVPTGLHKVEFFCRVPHFKSSFLISFFLISAGVLLTIRLWNQE